MSEYTDEMAKFIREQEELNSKRAKPSRVDEAQRASWRMQFDQNWAAIYRAKREAEGSG